MQKKSVSRLCHCLENSLLYLSVCDCVCAFVGLLPAYVNGSQIWPLPPHSSILLPWLIGLLNEHLHKKACPKSTFSLSKFNFFRETFITFFALISNSAFIVFFSYVRLFNTVQYTLGTFYFNFVKLCLMFCCVKNARNQILAIQLN